MAAMASKENKRVVSLKFALEVEDGWPPVSVESLPFEMKSTEEYLLLKPPLFVKDLSVGDVISALKFNQDGSLISWQHTVRSARTTVWLLRLKQTDEIKRALDSLRKLGCNTVGLDLVGCYSIDVPDTIKMADVDMILSRLDSNSVAVAFPSMRHPD